MELIDREKITSFPWRDASGTEEFLLNMAYKTFSEQTVMENDADIVEFGKKIIKEMVSVLDKEPAVDAEPVVHAHWRYNPNANDFGLGGWCCSECGFKNDVLGMSKKLPFPIKMLAGTSFCPHCGAKMDEEGEHNDD